jgi:hypothetical protein
VNTIPHENPARPERGRIEELAALLVSALSIWAARDDTLPQPAIRQAANTAGDTIDAMMRELYITRQRLVGEMRQSDDAAMARSGELLARPGKRRLCAHADLDGAGMHWLEPGETCPRLAQCGGCTGRGTGTRCCICDLPIPPGLRRSPGDPSELPDGEL